MIRAFNNIEISFETNEIIIITENNSKNRTKVEPRIMHVLQILMNNSPKVVPREQLIEEVWNNYGGADDALNQAISHLRKLLNDNDKENRIIETVVKKGYQFIRENNIISDEKRKFSYAQHSSIFWMTISVIVLLTLAFLAYSTNAKNSNVPVAPVDNEINVTEPKPAPDVDQN